MCLNFNFSTKFKLFTLSILIAAAHLIIVSHSEYKQFGIYLKIKSTAELLRGSIKSWRSVGASVSVPSSENYRISPTVGCRGRDVTLAICVSSRRENFQARRAIRETWGQHRDAPNRKTILLFFTGSETTQVSMQPNSTTQQMLELESLEFGDIVQDSFVDSFRNLTLKTLSILKWVITHCPKSQFALKADDDTYVNIPLLLEHLQHLANTSDRNTSFILGQMANSVVPLRDPTSDQFVSLRDYRETLFPSYVYGSAYAMTTPAATLLHEASKTTPYFYKEDVYVTGLCSRKAGVPIVHSGLFSNYRLPLSGCVFRRQITGHMVHHTEMVKIHMELQNKSIICE